MAIQRSSPTPVDRVVGSTGLADVLDRILDKGLVIDAWIRVSIVGLEILTVEARVVVASVDTYLRYAAAIGKVQLASAPPSSQEAEAPPQLQAAPRQLPSQQDIQHYLEERGEVVGIDELADHFGAPREALAERVRRLESEGSVAMENEAQQEGHP